MAIPKTSLHTKRSNSTLITGNGWTSPNTGIVYADGYVPNTITGLSIDLSDLEVPITDGYNIVFIDVLAMYHLYSPSARATLNYDIIYGGINKSLCVAYNPTFDGYGKFKTQRLTKASDTNFITEYGITDNISYIAPNMSFALISDSGGIGTPAYQSYVSPTELNVTNMFWKLNMINYTMANAFGQYTNSDVITYDLTDLEHIINVNVTLDADGVGQFVESTNNLYWHVEADIRVVQQIAY